MNLRQLITTVALLCLAVELYSQTEKEKLICQKWVYEKSADPYNNGAFHFADSTNAKYIIFKSDGSYADNDNNNSALGFWKFNHDSTRLGIKYTVFNDKEVDNKEPISEFRWIIYELTRSNMILGIQGRHGIVRYTYNSIN